MGEGGVIGSLLAVIDAVADARGRLGVRLTRQPLSRGNVIAAIEAVAS
jgi:CO/xanthine dehydrogenase Mo-binding subunit